MTSNRLKELQALPYEEKVRLSKAKIREYYEKFDGNVAVGFSGGKDSTVLLHLVRSLYPDVKGVFFNTTNEHTEIIKFVKKVRNIDIVTPKKTFKWSLLYEGYPLISKELSEIHRRLFGITHIEPGKIIKTAFTYAIIKTKEGAKLKIPKKWLIFFDKLMIDKLYSIVGTPFFNQWYSYDANAANVYNELREYYYDIVLSRRAALGLDETDRIRLTNRCCDILKKNPSKGYQRRYGVAMFIGIMASDSELRKKSIAHSGCFNERKNQIYPMAWWKQENVRRYIEEHNLTISSAYETEDRTGCAMCGFGLAMDSNRFDRLGRKSPKKYDYYRKLKNVYSDKTFGEAIDIVLSIIREGQLPSA